MAVEETAVFQVPAGRYASAEAFCRLKRAAWIPALFLAAALTAAVFDSRFIYVALILLFIIFPMGLTMGWLSIISKPVYIRRQRPQSWSLGDDGILMINYYDGENNVADREEIPLDSICDIETGKSHTILSLGQKRHEGFLIVPTDICPSKLAGLLLNNNIE